VYLDKILKEKFKIDVNISEFLEWLDKYDEEKIHPFWNLF
jgi:hypothetical protein